jgi:putative cell wall-binding protein
MRRALAFVVSVVTFAAVLAVGGGASAVVEYPPFTVKSIETSGLVESRKPEIDRNLVAFQLKATTLGSKWNVALHDIKTGTRHVLSDSGSNQTEPDIAWPWLVYQSDASDAGDIYLAYVGAGPEAAYGELLAGGSDEQVQPRVCSSHVVWKNATDNVLEYFDMNDDWIFSVPESANAKYWDTDDGVLLFSVDEPAPTPDTLWMWRYGEMGYPVKVYTAEATTYNFPDIVHVRMHGTRAHIGISSGFAATIVNLDLRSQMRGIRLTAKQLTRPNLFHTYHVFERSNTTVLGSTPRELNFELEAKAYEYLPLPPDDGLDHTRPAIFGNRVAFESGESGNIQLADAPPRIDRTSGADRYETAVKISKAYYPDHSDYTNHTVVICTGENFPDALAATPLASQIGAPLLLTRSASIPQVVLAEIDRLKPTRAIIVGGTGAVSQAAENQLKARITYVDRVWGSDRYQTALKVADEYFARLAYDGIVWDGGFFLARGDAFPDALAAGPVAAGARRPILLTKPGALPAAVDAKLSSATPKYQRCIIVGGTSAVSASVKTRIDQIMAANTGTASLRWDGSDRYATAARLANEGAMPFRRWVDMDMLGVATGENFPDALGGGAVCGAYGSPLLLTSRTAVPAALSTFLSQREYTIGRVDIFGGQSVVGEAVRTSIAGKLK